MASKAVIENRKKSVPVADILRDAANKYLLTTSQRFDGAWYADIEKYSCNAVKKVLQLEVRPDIHMYNQPMTKQEKKVFAFLRELGVDTKCIYQFNNISPAEQQDARFAWLHFAADIAEEEGLMC